MLFKESFIAIKTDVIKCSDFKFSKKQTLLNWPQLNRIDIHIIEHEAHFYSCEVLLFDREGTTIERTCVESTPCSNAAPDE